LWIILEYIKSCIMWPGRAKYHLIVLYDLIMCLAGGKWLVWSFKLCFGVSRCTQLNRDECISKHPIWFFFWKNTATQTVDLKQLIMFIKRQHQFIVFKTKIFMCISAYWCNEWIDTIIFFWALSWLVFVTELHIHMDKYNWCTF